MSGDRVPSWLMASPTAIQEIEGKNGKRGERVWVPGQLPSRLSGDSTARYVSRRMSQLLNVPLIENRCSAELIDITRSVRHRCLFPTPIMDWPEELRQRLIEEVHAPYRECMERSIRDLIRNHGFVIHLSIRSFALRSNGKWRRADVGLLYDTSRKDEVDFCLDWIDEMYEGAAMLRVRRNYPSRGTKESVVTAMRGLFSSEPYVGVELLVNRAWASRSVALRDEAITGLCNSLHEILSSDIAEAA